jgi:hypothetical protein
MGPIHVGSDIVMLLRRPVKRELIAAAEARLAALGAQTVAGQEDGMPPWFFDRELVEHAARQKERTLAETQVIRLGDAALAALPGEFFTEYGLQLKEKSPARYTLPIGLANGALGYIPTPEALTQGGYEAQTWRYNQYDSESGPRIIASTLNLLQTAFSA